MVQELRQLVFAPHDLACALDHYRSQHPDFLPKGEVWVQGVAKDGALRVKVTMSYGNNTQDAMFDVASADVLRALVTACSELKIPMPQSGKKSLVGTPKGVSLHIKIDAGEMAPSNKVELDSFAGAKQLKEMKAAG